MGLLETLVSTTALIKDAARHVVHVVLFKKGTACEAPVNADACC